MVKILLGFQADQIPIVAANDQITAALFDMGLAHEMVVNSQAVGVDMGNRGGEGVNAMEVDALGVDIINDGFSPGKTSHACCIQQRPGMTDIEEFTASLRAGTDLPPVEKGEIQYGSLSCSHTAQLLVKIAKRGLCSHPKMSDGGRYCLQTLERHDPAFAHAVRTGLTWTVLSWRVREWYPEVIDIVQAGRNMRADRGESEMQTMLKLHSRAAAATLAGNAPDWAAIRREVLKTRPPAANKLESLIAFVVARSGGLHGKQLRYLASFHRNAVSSSLRQGVPAALYEALSMFHDQTIAMAVLACAWTCPKKFVKDFVCTYVAPNDVTVLQKDSNPRGTSPMEFKRVAAASKMLNQARAAVSQHRGPQEAWSVDVIKSVGLFDALVARYLLKKSPNVISLQGLCDRFVNDYCALAPTCEKDEVVAHFDFEEGEGHGEGEEGQRRAQVAMVETARLATQPAVPEARLVEMDEVGELVGAMGKLHKAGWDIGHKLTLSKAPTADFALSDVFVIVSGRQGVELCLASAPAKVVCVNVDEFIAQAQPLTGDDLLVRQEGWPAKRLKLTKSGAESIMKGRAMFALDILMSGTGLDVADSVEVLTKPEKAVRAIRAVSTGQLVLLPESTKCVCLYGQAATVEAEKQGSVEVFYTTEPTGFEGRLFLVGCSTAEQIAPRWLLGKATRPEEVNMVTLMYRVQVCGGCDPVGESASSLREAQATRQMAAASSPCGPIMPGVAQGDGDAEDLEIRQARDAQTQEDHSKKAEASDAAILVLQGEEAFSGGEEVEPARKKYEQPPLQEAPSGIPDIATGTRKTVTADDVPPNQALAVVTQRYDGHGTTQQYYMYVPVMVNSKPLQVGSVLRMATVDKVKKATVRAPVSVVQTIKKLRLM